ncbi:MAG: phosphatidylglycerophosphatase A [Neisseriaceae bacterium]|nr:phosphatidylglycerophosphatase A [Neisseriaceae bacterium]MBP6860875.1 phosphatidylglycerophosphatase A [Neisseriaceae bacterium]
MTTKKPITPTFKWLKEDYFCMTAFGFGAGLAPVAPGTFGTLPALVIAYVLFSLGMSPLALSILCWPLFLIGIHICQHAEDKVGVSDYGGIVWDEIVAMLLILSTVPFSFGWWLIAFILFRLFDALKPWPISYFNDKVHGGFGIMLDDILAAIPCIVILGILQWF